MRCHANQVEIAGWGEGYAKFTIDVSQPEKLKLLQTDTRPEGGGDGREPPNLGLWCRPGIFTLISGDPLHTYQIVCTASEKPVNGGIEHFHKSEIVQKDGTGKVTARLQVFEGSMLETID